MLWAPFDFSFRRQWSVWYIVVWANGDRERAEEDYAPWSAVAEMQSGVFMWEADALHRGQHTCEWVREREREAVLKNLGIALDDF